MPYSYKIGISAEEHDNFVKSSPQVNLLQSSNWAKIKDNWDNDRIGFYHDDSLVASASLLIKHLPLGMTMIYIPRGPIMDYGNQELVKFVLTSLKQYGKTKKALFIKFDPNIHLKSWSNDEQNKDNSSSLAIIKNLESLGAEWSGRTKDISENIQPRFQANVYATSFAVESLSKRTRQRLRTARNKEIDIVFGGEELLPTFSELMKKTENRKQINLRNIDYYRKLLSTYPNDSYITLAQIDISKKSEKLKLQLQKYKTEAQYFDEKTKTGKIKENQVNQERLFKELKLFNELISEGITILPLAATLSLNFGTTSENLYAGMDDSYKSYDAPILVWYETMNHAFDLGLQSQNMGGIENQLQGGLYHFKSNFNPTIEEFIGEFNLPVNPFLYKLSNFAYKIRKQLRSNH